MRVTLDANNEGKTSLRTANAPPFVRSMNNQAPSDPTAKGTLGKYQACLRK